MADMFTIIIIDTLIFILPKVGIDLQIAWEEGTAPHHLYNITDIQYTCIIWL